MENRFSRWRRAGAAAATLALGASLVVAGGASAAKSPQNPNAKSFEVMTQNLYLGADVGIALGKFPNITGAAQFMWDQVTATDFTTRVPKLAATAARYAPDVIGLQEATVWKCQKDEGEPIVEIYNFTKDYLKATKDAGEEYVIAEKDGNLAFNEGFKIGPIVAPAPFGSKVFDKDTFPAFFDGQKWAYCGFQLGDALLVRENISDQVTAAGWVDYEHKFEIPFVPTALVDLTRGYAWADVTVSGNDTKFVTTHLESMWTPGERTPAGIQSEELVETLKDVEKPLVVMGDFNSDPRDPRPEGALNPGGQPEASTACPAQRTHPTAGSANAECNSYWTMRQGGYRDVGPDVFDPMNYTWGSQSELAGPDPSRVEVALGMGNPYGFTDRLDYMFVKNRVKVMPRNTAEIIGNAWPYSSDNWTCGTNDPKPPLGVTQEENTAAMSEVLKEAGVIDNAITNGKGVCFPTDHAGVVSELRILPGQQKRNR